jgi:hypothetical protein
MGIQFGSFNAICETAALVICPLVETSQGVEPTCYSRNVEIGGTLIFQPCEFASILFVNWFRRKGVFFCWCMGDGLLCLPCVKDTCGLLAYPIIFHNPRERYSVEVRWGVTCMSYSSTKKRYCLEEAPLALLLLLLLPCTLSLLLTPSSCSNMLCSHRCHYNDCHHDHTYTEQVYGSR